MREYSEELLDIVSNNPFCIISGTTGSGKSTQVPQILLEEALRHGPDQTCNIICTEPRRVAVTTLAERVAAERAEGVGDSVGYRVSFDRVLPRMPQRVTYCTPEILSLQMLHSNEDVLANLTHIIVDEVHERNARTDGLLSQLKLAYDNRVRAGKPFPKVILMSASLDGGLIEEYFSLRTADGKVKRCPVLTVPGKVHEVEYKDLEDVDKELSSDTVLRTARTLLRDSDYEKFMKLEKAVKPLASSPSNMLIGWRSEWEIAQDREEARVSYALVAATIAKICKSDEKGAILAFLPGWNEIKRVEELLQRGKVFGLDFKNTSKFRISLLHSTNPAGMEEALTPLPDTCRKILLATNIAETSITIPDVRFVVDSAKQRTPRYDHVRKLSVLDREWVSRSSIVQRAGRAGRTQPGTYYGLLSKNRHELLRDTIAQPSIDSSHLHLACLRARSQFPEMSLPEYFAQLLEAPSRDEVAAAVKDLQNIGAIGPDLTVTLFGRLLGEFPTQPSITRMILLGVMFRCLQPMIVLGGFLTTNQQFFMHPETTKDKLRADAIRAIYSQGTASDHIASISAFDELQSIETREGPDAAVEWAEKSFLNIHAFKIVQKYMLQIQRVMWDRRIVRDIYSAEHNVNSTELSLIKALFLSGVAPNVGLRRTSNQFWTRSGTEALLPMDSAARPTHWIGLLETRRGISTQPATADGPEQMDEKESVTGH
ncbi:P-loop containing nucleoside triphosphate hydrolase protein [Eremomyces bilateralis CBS 781.70]|uniref:P-loop containing nucleoside triphosphate hydrolase protein n=1 Tax=Eremomyces bilateralis CBS 781.70 TaxID=1392243 RepID=A0A6G1G4G0_9PEZI|nr:P-loop containing nucleoside triphosphate hydrolase protein [Eremomyces bilateralis CBS 781.70]KAF1812957.1 P-loop containing nucleoside triphosphate hydrolase protein [Eremomyces bilateralis CBS 781.70]